MTNTIAQSRAPLALALVLCAILAVAALSGWYFYFTESNKNSALAGENSDYRQRHGKYGASDYPERHSQSGWKFRDA